MLGGNSHSLSEFTDVAWKTDWLWLSGSGNRSKSEVGLQFSNLAWYLKYTIILFFYSFYSSNSFIPFTPIADGFIGSRGCVRSDLLSGHSFTQSVYHIIYHLITCTTLCFWLLSHLQLSTAHWATLELSEWLLRLLELLTHHLCCNFNRIDILLKINGVDISNTWAIRKPTLFLHHLPRGLSCPEGLER